MPPTSCAGTATISIVCIGSDPAAKKPTHCAKPVSPFEHAKAASVSPTHDAERCEYSIVCEAALLRPMAIPTALIDTQLSFAGTHQYLQQHTDG
jgi:hypothetical protein